MKKGEFRLTPFSPGEDGLAAEHAAVSQWVEDALASLGPRDWYQEVLLKNLNSGKVLLDAKPDQARRYVLAALAQVRHWDQEADRARSQAENEMERMNTHHLPGWSDVWSRRRQAAAIIFALTRRNLPFVEGDLVALLDWGSSVKGISTYFAPLGNIARALQRYADQHGITPAMREAMQRFASCLRETYDKDARRAGAVVERLCDEMAPEQKVEVPIASPTPLRSIRPAPAGNPAVLEQLKRYLGLAAPDTPAIATEQIGPDRFIMRTDSPFSAEHQLISDLFNEEVGTIPYDQIDLDATAAGKKILASSAAERGWVLVAAAERAISALLGSDDLGDGRLWRSRYAAPNLVTKLALLEFVLDRQNLFDFLLFAGTRDANWHSVLSSTTTKLFAQIDQVAAQSPLTDGERYVLHLLRAMLRSGPSLGLLSDAIRRLTEWIGDGATFYLGAGEAWSDAANADIGALSPTQRQQWTDLLKHLLTATAARPSSKWLKTAAKLVDAVGEENVGLALGRWFTLVDQGRTIRRLGSWYGDAQGRGDVMHEENATCLRGMLWLVPRLQKKNELVRAVAAVAQSAYRKVPGVGPRAVKVGNAAVYALSEIGCSEAVGQLAMLKVRVKFGTAQKEIEKAFNTAAEKLGLPRDQIEELGVPTYGLEQVGLRRESFGEEFTAEIRVNGREVTLGWLRKDGKPQKSVPAKVKSEYKEEWKELQGAMKDISAMLPAQAERLDAMFLLQKRWPLATWRERYLNHPLVGTLARRLIWAFKSGDRERAGMWHEGQLVAADDAPLDLNADAEVELWHPIGRPVAEVLAWREWLQRHEVRQPFKQAHREVYLLTDAERRTQTYSNRFAAHILRQHQFNALCAARGWKNKLRLMVDDEYPPASRELPQWELRAEFWIEGIGEEYGQDTNDSGAFLRLATDQVRFYRLAAAANRAHAGGGGYVARAEGPGDGNINQPLPLEQIPPLVLSEIMRDVDLFVGVASIGNDPTWQDGGPGGRYQTYWQSYSFGELSETAQTRRAVLESLLPRLSKIRDRCGLEERFLVVRGDLRTYKIHLGSGNILMAPNDEYLCIVPDRSAEAGKDIFLPFEGDATLSIILSKAFLLAEDTKIQDPTITRQIQSK